MNLLDENVPSDQQEMLEAWGIHCRVIGQDIAKLSIGDNDIVTLLHHLKQPTLFSRDRHFFKRRLCHAGYGLVWLDALPEEAAFFIRRFLNHPRFKTKTGRMGAVARAHQDGIHWWERNRATLQCVAWSEG